MSPCGSTCTSRDWKGKGRALPNLFARGDKAEDGVLIPLDLLEDSTYQAVYTIPVTVGKDKQVFPVQVDTGSSDLWLASTSCGSQSCKQTGGKLYNPSGATASNQDFTIRYVQGVVQGPIVWDQVELGGYSIEMQALAAATSVDDEPLSSNFVGVMGLALPQNSVIAEEIPPVTGNGADGASISSNIFSITPASNSPAHRFMSLTLARPGSDRISSLLGIGRHSDVITDPALIEYAPLVSGSAGPYFWETSLVAVTVYVDGVRKQIDVGKSAATGGTPTAIVDSGMPVILASQSIANGIYGAIGIGPASDGQYYVPCTTPLNMTITLDNRTAIALHPLDLTIETSGGSSCLGLIQAYPPSSSVSNVGDIILGVPFMRSTYSVMAYDPPDANGKLPNSSSVSMTSIRPRLGLFGLTDPTIALDEFHTVRVLNQPLPTSGNPTKSGQASVSGNSSGHPLSVGIKVLIGIGSFVGLCVLIFVARWFWSRRTLKLRGIGNTTPEDDKEADAAVMQEALYRLARRNSGGSRYGPSEDTLRAKKFQEYLNQQAAGRDEVISGYSDDTARTHVAGDGEDEKFDPGALQDHELGYRKVKTHIHSDSESSDAPVPGATWNDNRATLVDSRHSSLPSPDNVGTVPRSFNLEYPLSPTHNRLPSAEASVAVPLLAHTRNDSDVGESGDFTGIGSGNSRARMSIGLGRPTSQASIDSTASRNSMRQSLEGRRRSSGGSAGPRFGPRPGSARIPSGLRESVMTRAAEPAAAPLLHANPPSPERSLLDLSTESNTGHQHPPSS